MRFNTFLLGFVALCVAFAAAFFSVTGLSKLFAGASLAIILMAGSLETAKLVVASYLHNRWKDISKLMRVYLVTAVIVLIGITSAGIYGFLTAAYQTTADELAILDRQTEVIELKKDRFREQLQDYRQEQSQLSESITNLNEGLANNTIQYTDSLGNVITTTSSATRRALTAQLDDQQEQRTFVRQKIEALTDSVTTLEIEALDLQRGSEVSAEIGPLRYMAEITGLPMADIVNYFALLIVFVFDPLAVAMVISFNHAIMLDRREKKKKEVEEGKEKGYKVYNEGDHTTPISESVNIPSVRVEEDVDDEDDTTFTFSRGMEWPDYDLFDEDDDIRPKEEPESPDEPFTEDDDLDEEEATDKDYLTVQEVQEDSSEKKKTINLDNLQRDYSRRPIDLGNDGSVDGFDTNGDGLIDQITGAHSMRARHIRKGHLKPYYAQKDFQWDNIPTWIHDQNAINYYLTYVKPTKGNNDPDDFTTKIY